VLLLDQFPRNAFRGTPRMYASDATARRIAAAAIEVGHDRQVPPELRIFLYLPFAHSEDISDQERSVALCRLLGPPNSNNSERHRDIVRRALPTPQSDSRPDHDRGGAGFPRSGRLCRIERDLRKPVSLITRNQKMAMSPTPRSCVRRHANLF